MKKLYVFVILLVVAVPFFSAQAQNEPVNAFSTPALGFASFINIISMSVEGVTAYSLLMPAIMGQDSAPDAGYIFYYAGAPLMVLNSWLYLSNMNKVTDLWLSRGVVFDRSSYEIGFKITAWTISGLAISAVILPRLFNDNIWSYGVMGALLFLCGALQELVFAEGWMKALSTAIRQSELDWKNLK